MKMLYKVMGALCVLMFLLSVSACGPSKIASDSASQAENGTAAESAQQESQKTVESSTVQDTEETTSPEAGQSRVLVAYFSATGHTKPIAEAVAALTGADLFEIVPVEAYTDEDLNYSDDGCRANQEQNDRTVRPDILGSIGNMDDYDMVFLGHPIWWGEEPRIMDTFLESYDLSGKTVVNFCTSGGSGVAASTENLKTLSPNANWLEGHRFKAGASADDVQKWLDGLNWNLE